jgi:hypothetical protein
MPIKKMTNLILLLFILIPIEFSTLKAQNSNNKRQLDLNTSTSAQTTQIKLTREKLEVEVRKLIKEAERLRVEIAKIKEETDSLKIENEAPDRNLRWLTVWFTALGGIFLGIIGIFLNITLKRTQKGKMEQEKKLGREKHILELFRELGSDKPQIRMGAASILLQQLKKAVKEKKAKDDEQKYELPMIASVLIAATKHEKEPKIQKYIADNIAVSLDAIVPDKKEAPDTPESPLKSYDFQYTKLNDAWWRRIDARGVDFFGASLKKAGLRKAFLNGAILMEANLEMATLREADLAEADLTGAILVKADLRDVDLSDSTIDGADFRGAKFNEGTKFRRDQLKVATFDAGVSDVVTFVG